MYKTEHVYVLHKTGACATGAICGICGEPITDAHYFSGESATAYYYHVGTCVTASRLGAPNEYHNND